MLQEDQVAEVQDPQVEVESVKVFNQLNQEIQALMDSEMLVEVMVEPYLLQEEEVVEEQVVLDFQVVVVIHFKQEEAA
jgi:hypothetical protein